MDTYVPNKNKEEMPVASVLGARPKSNNIKINKLLALTLVTGVTSLLGFAPAISSAAPFKPAPSTVVVTAADLDNTSSSPAVVVADGLNKWFMYNDTTDKVDNSLGSFVLGPSTPVRGTGSVEFTLGANPNDRKNIATYQFGGTKLSDIDELSYVAYSQSGVAGPNESPFLNFNVDLSGSNTWQKRLVYVPSANMASVPQDTWNTFDVLNNGNALWTWSGFNGTWPDGSHSQYRTWSDILTAFPNARILPSDPWFGVRVGEPGPTGYTGAVDAVTFGTHTKLTTFDFEKVHALPAHYSDCRNGGWKQYNDPSFKNQDQCMDYVWRHAHVIDGDSVKYTAYGLNREANFWMSTSLNRGSFYYKDANHDWYYVRVSDVEVNGNNGYFAGQVMRASNPGWVGNWLYGEVQNGHPDEIWGSFTNQTTAENSVNNMSPSPADGPFTVTHGSISIYHRR